jgi:hypothetical protein
MKRYPNGERIPGKKVGPHFYIHKSAIGHLSPTSLAIVEERMRSIGNWDYDIIKIDSLTGNVSFIQVHQWDEIDEPLTGDSLVVYPDGTTKIHRMSVKDPLIYHHKWSFVGDDYTGFDPQESFERSERWITNPALQELINDPSEKFSSKIGRSSYWREKVIPHMRRSGGARCGCKNKAKTRSKSKK